MIKRILFVLTCVVTALVCAACSSSVDGSSTTPNSSNTSSSASSSASSTDTSSLSSTNTSSVISSVSSTASGSNNVSGHPTLETPWIDVPFTSQKQADAGIAGGEGCQWPTYISFDQIDGSLAFLGIDVGGMYRSKDGGQTWEPCTIGITASAASCAEVDPTNIKRVLCVGVDSGHRDSHGLYLSTDGGDSWKHVNPQKVQGHRDFRHQIAYDKSSYDSKKGYCTTVYYVRESKQIGNNYLPPALFKSTDGGETWKEICSDSAIGNGMIYVHPTKGWVYIANEKGAIRSKDGGKTFNSMLKKTCYGICVVNSKPDNVYISAKDGFYVSTNGGNNFSKVNTSGYPTRYPARVNVSPANPNKMVLQDDHLSDNGSYSSKNYYSHDGGKTWKQCTVDSSMSFIPYNIRQTVFAWHPTNENICISTGGDMAMRSTNGGKTFKWSGSGYSGSCTSGIYMNVNNYDLIFCSNQDYNGAFTTNGGKTWTYTPCSGESWGGLSYGGYPISKDTCAIITTKDKRSYYITMMTEGGTNRVTTSYQVTGEKRGYGQIGNDKIVFLGEWRSADAGKTWSKMSGCTGVYTCSKKGVLYGRDENKLVTSTNGGKSWKALFSLSSITDMAYDEYNNRLLVLVGADIYAYNESANKLTKTMTVNHGKCNSIDVDPRNGNIYASVRSEGYECKQIGVVRSMDGGKTWVNLSRAPGDGSVGLDGGKKPDYIVFNRKYNEVWTNCGCRGVWKIKAKA